MVTTDQFLLAAISLDLLFLAMSYADKVLPLSPFVEFDHDYDIGKGVPSSLPSSPQNKHVSRIIVSWYGMGLSSLESMPLNKTHPGLPVVVNVSMNVKSVVSIDEMEERIT